jgi:DNA-binding transcriptional LysR family regulator
MSQINWDDLRFFLAVARSGRLSGGAQRLQYDQSTVARRVERLEEALQAKLMLRSPIGVTLTPGGVKLLEYAERIEGEVLEAASMLDDEFASLSGSVRIATPEAFGSHLVAPNLGLLRQSHPNLQLELIPSTLVSVSKREADLLVTVRRPNRGRTTARKLADYDLGLYASRAYLQRRGEPDSLSALRSHDFIWQINDLAQSETYRMLRGVVSGASVVFSSNSTLIQYGAVASGRGVGLLHRFLARRNDDLVPLLPDINIRRTYWVVFSSDQQKSTKIRAVLAFLDKVIEKNRAAMLGGPV